MSDFLNLVSENKDLQIYLIFFALLVLVILLMVFFSLKDRKLFKKYYQMASHKNILGADAAMQMLKSLGFDNIKVRFKTGENTDKYDSKAATVYLSEKVHNGSSVASLYMAAREVNNVLFHAHHPKMSWMVNMNDKIYAVVAVFSLSAVTMVNGMADIISDYPSSMIAWILFAVASAWCIAIAASLAVKKVMESKLSENSVKLLMDEKLIYDDEAKIAKKIIHEVKISNIVELIANAILYLLCPIASLLTIIF